MWGWKRWSWAAAATSCDAVKKGQLLLRFDLEAITAAGYRLTTPVVVTNSDDYAAVEPAAKGRVEAGQDLLVVR